MVEPGVDEEGFENLKMRPVIQSEMQSQDAQPFQSLSTLSKFQIAVRVCLRLTFTYLAFLRILPLTLSKHWAVMGLTGFIGQALGRVSKVLYLKCSLRECVTQSSWA